MQRERERARGKERERERERLRSLLLSRCAMREDEMRWGLEDERVEEASVCAGVFKGIPLQLYYFYIFIVVRPT